VPQDYDLAIIGGTTAARAAAIEALNFQVRVALILPDLAITYGSPNAKDPTHLYGDLYPQALAAIAKSHRSSSTRLGAPASYPWKYARAAIDRLEQQHHPALLAAMGIDTIVGMGKFQLLPHLGFNINQRCIRAKAYLIASGSIPANPQIPGLEEVDYLTIDRLTEIAETAIPQHWAIIGNETIGVELAQTLARLGCKVTLIIDTEQILPHEDRKFANYIQAQLEADGVRIYLVTTVKAVMQNSASKLVILDSVSIAVDEVFIALPERPLIEPFDLTEVGVAYDRKGISIDNKLRTSNPNIYACGSVCGNVLGGYRSDGLTQSEAKIAVHNALSWRKTKVNYHNYNGFPWAVHTEPPLARVGMKIDEAIQSKRKDIIILEQYFKNCPQAILNNTTTGVCQIIATYKGDILGAAIVGQNAPELIQIIALAIQHQLKITDLKTFPSLSPSYTELIDLTLEEWFKYRRSENSQKLSWLRRLWK
jgi:pyruvate/2-oxoglutarate dehydrogenase complex dihydrolipoamide dehydrogenase (E3) component